MGRLIHSQRLWKALIDAGVFREDERITRCIIDMTADGAVVMHIQRWGDERLLEVVAAGIFRDAEVRDAAD